MPTLLFGCLCLFDFQVMKQLFENLRLLEILGIGFTHQHPMSIEPFITFGKFRLPTITFQKSLIPMIIQVPTIINILKISHAYCNSGAYLY